MGKTVKTVMKIAAGAAIGVFAPMLAPALLGAVGTASATALATTVASAAIGAAAGEAIGIGWKAGMVSGGFGGAQSSGLFGGTAASATPGVDAVVASPELAAQAAAEQGITTGATTAAAPAAGAASGLDAFMQSPELASKVAAEGGTTAAAGAPAAGVSTATAPATLGARLGAAATQVGNAGLAGVKAIAPQLAASVLTGNPGAGLAKAQQEELLRAQQANASLTQARLSEANKLIGDANYYDPEYMGRQAAEAAAIRGGLQATEETRGLTGARLDAERRRYKLGTARNVGTAYQQGFSTGVGARTQTRAAGISAIPNEYPMTNPAGTLYTQNAARTARDTETQRLSALFAQALGRDKAKSAGPLKPEEEDAAA